MDGYGKRVLVVEDDEHARCLLAVLLVRAGYNVHTAGDGLEALDEMKRRRFDAVITDYHMPRLDGLEFLAFSRIVWTDTPVVMVSGDRPDMSQLAVQQGAYAWMRKPYDSAQLLEILRTAIRQSAEKRAHLMTAHA